MTPSAALGTIPGTPDNDHRILRCTMMVHISFFTALYLVRCAIVRNLDSCNYLQIWESFFSLVWCNRIVCVIFCSDGPGLVGGEEFAELQLSNQMQDSHFYAILCSQFYVLVQKMAALSLREMQTPANWLELVENYEASSLMQAINKYETNKKQIVLFIFVFIYYFYYYFNIFFLWCRRILSSAAYLLTLFAAALHPTPPAFSSSSRIITRYVV